jgi:hypothetical protein
VGVCTYVVDPDIPPTTPAVEPVIVPLGCNDSEVMSSIPLTSRNSGASLLCTRIRFVNVWSRAVSATASLYAGRAARSVGGPIDAQFASAAMSKRRKAHRQRSMAFFQDVRSPTCLLSEGATARAARLEDSSSGGSQFKVSLQLVHSNGFLRPHFEWHGFVLRFERKDRPFALIAKDVEL